MDPLPERLRSLGDRYHFERELGRGGMATVYLARDLKHDRLVAVKTLRPDLAASLGAQRFLREIQFASRLAHPHILPLHDSGEVEGLFYYVMPYVPGESLRDLLRREKRLPVDVALRLAREVADALGYAHEQGIVHRDIKPENILLQSGHAIVSDFGIARAVTAATTVDAPEGASLTNTGIMLGTPLYMSPEQILGGPLDGRSDVYSLGCILYEMLTGSPPFAATTAQGILAGHATQAPRSPRELRREIPISVERIVSQALAKSPDERIPSAAAFATALADAGTSRSTGTRPRRLIAAGVALVVVAGGIAAVWLRVPDRASMKSVAVIPFANESSSAEDQYAADGMSDELINALGGIPGLRVASRSSVYALRDAHLGSPALSSKLRARILIEGSVQRADSQLRVAVQLIDGRTDSVLWTTTVRRAQRGLFELQEELVQAIVVELRQRTGGTAHTGLIRRGTTNVDAYVAYLKGRHLWEERESGPIALQRAAGYFESALALDSTYARAWAGLADVYSMLPAFGDTPPSEAFAKARSAARRALDIDSTLAEAYTSLGVVSVFYDWDWPTARREFDRAIALDSTDARTYLMNAWSYVPIGDVDAALRSVLTAQRLDPTSPVVNARVGSGYIYTRRYNDAVTGLRAALELDSGNYSARSELIRALVGQGRPDEALKVPPVSLALQAGYLGAATMARAYAAAGQLGKARETQREVQELSRKRFITPEALAAVAIAVGDSAQALDLLERAFKERGFYMAFLGEDPIWEPLYGNPRYERLVREMHLARFGLRATTARR